MQSLIQPILVILWQTDLSALNGTRSPGVQTGNRRERDCIGRAAFGHWWKYEIQSQEVGLSNNSITSFWDAKTLCSGL